MIMPTTRTEAKSATEQHLTSEHAWRIYDGPLAMVIKLMAVEFILYVLVLLKD